MHPTPDAIRHEQPLQRKFKERARKRQPSIQRDSNRSRGICQLRWPLHRAVRSQGSTRPPAKSWHVASSRKRTTGSISRVNAPGQGHRRRPSDHVRVGAGCSQVTPSRQSVHESRHYWQSPGSAQDSEGVEGDHLAGPMRCVPSRRPHVGGRSDSPEVPTIVGRRPKRRPVGVCARVGRELREARGSSMRPILARNISTARMS